MERLHRGQRDRDLEPDGDEVDLDVDDEIAAGKRPRVQRKPAAAEVDEATAWRRLARAMEGGSAPLPTELRARLEGALGADLAQVRVHDDAAAADAAAALAARAFAVGQHIFLGAGERGDDVLAHEVAHTVQQASASIDGDRLEVSSPGDAHEREADRFADAFAAGLATPAVTPVARGSASRAAIHRLAAGDLKTRTYKQDAQPDGSGDYMRAGCLMILEFAPGNSVDATEIGFIQTVVAQKKGKKRATTDGSAADTKTQQDRQVPAKEDPGGTAVDRSADKTSPVYGQNNDGSMNTSGGGNADNVLGKRAMNAGGTVEVVNAVMSDWPHFMDVGPDSGQKFETAVLALKGGQAGTYYGTMTWGWEIDSGGTFNLLPATPKDGNPSPLFQRAAQIWNQASNVNGAKNVQIPIPMENEANGLATPALIARYNSEGDPIVKAIFRVVLARRTFTIDVTPGADASPNLYVTVTGARTYTSPRFKASGGGSMPFLVTFGDVMGDANVPPLQIAVMDHNTILADDRLNSLTWSPPFGAANVGGKCPFSVHLGG